MLDITVPPMASLLACPYPGCPRSSFHGAQELQAHVQSLHKGLAEVLVTCGKCCRVLGASLQRAEKHWRACSGRSAAYLAPVPAIDHDPGVVSQQPRSRMPPPLSQRPSYASVVKRGLGQPSAPFSPVPPNTHNFIRSQTFWNLRNAQRSVSILDVSSRSCPAPSSVSETRPPLPSSAPPSCVWHNSAFIGGGGSPRCSAC